MSDHRAQVTRLYDTVFDRAPDAPGLDFWVNHMNNGWTLDTVAGLFITADEFALTYGQPDNRSFVAEMYRNVLDREGEPLGVAGWTGWLDSGAMDRSDVVVGFSESAEHVLQMRAAAEATSSAPPSGGEPVPAEQPATPVPASSAGVTRDPNGYPTITGTDGDDTIYGTTDAGYDPSVNYRFRPGDDPIKGLGGNDVIHGLSGADYLEGGDGRDTILGAPGDDHVIGGGGFDRLEGGDGNDVFAFAAGDGLDTISVFRPGDRIQFSNQSEVGWQLLAPQGGATGATLSYGPAGGDWYPDQILLVGITEADLGWVRDAIFA